MDLSSWSTCAATRLTVLVNVGTVKGKISRHLKVEGDRTYCCMEKHTVDEALRRRR